MFKVQALNIKQQSRGFTLFELLIVIALLVLITAMVLPFGVDFFQEQRVTEEAVTLAENIKNAQARAMAGQQDSSWGIRFNMPEEGKYIMFKGESFDDPERETLYDELFFLSPGAELEFSENIEEIVFEKLTGRLTVR